MLTRSSNPSQEYVNEWVTLPETNEQGNHYVAHRYGILTTSFIAYAVYEPSSLMGAHSSITCNDGHWLGDVTTRRLPSTLEALTPGSKARIDAVTLYQDGWKAFTESLIRSAFPQDFESDLQRAWKALQSMPSYVEAQARVFAGEA